MKLLIILRVVFVAISGCFFFVGAALEGDLRPHHKSTFDFDEVLFTELNPSILAFFFFYSFQRALFISASMFIRIVKDVLGAK